MKRFSRPGLLSAAALAAFLAALSSSLIFAQVSPGTTIKRVAISRGGKGTDLEITANQPVATDTRVLTDPDRIVIDFPGALPGNRLKGFPVNRGSISAVRTALYATNPPTTRVVIDLKAPTAYQVIPSGNGVIVKLGGAPDAALGGAVEKTTPAPIPVGVTPPALIPIIVRAPREPSSAKATIKRIELLGSQKGMELEITTSQPVATDTRVLTDPDRVVIDFPGAVPGDQLKGFAVNHGAMKGVRVGLLSSHPPTTRVVVDLNAPSPYQVFPSGNTVLVKLGSGSSLSANVAIARSVPPPRAALPPAPRVAVSFKDGQLSIEANKATLAEVLYQVHMSTGADIAIPAGAERETVIVKAGPGPATEVMSTVLNGSHFNFVAVGSEQDQNALRTIILTAKNGEESPPLPEQPPAVTEEVPSEVPALNDNVPPPPVSSLPQVPLPPDQNVPPEPPPDQPQ
jgi:phosphate uptake regulator